MKELPTPVPLSLPREAVVAVPPSAPNWYSTSARGSKRWPPLMKTDSPLEDHATKR